MKKFKFNVLHLTALIFLSACNSKVEIVNELYVPDAPLIEYYLESSNTSNYLEYIEDFGNYEIKYIGPEKSEISIDKKVEITNNDNTIASSKDYKVGSKNSVKIVVNTRQVFEEINSNTQNTYRAYPIIITNISKETVKIGMGENLNLLLLGRKKEGNWKVIDKRTNYTISMNKIIDLLLKENQMAISLAGITNGNTEVIMKYIMANDDFENAAESNEFSGRIDHQFLEN